MDRVLITGGAGFIGSHSARRFLERGVAVVALDNFDPFYDVGIKRRNVGALSAFDAFELVEGDIRSAETLDRVLSSTPFDAVVHLAARAGVRPSIAEPSLYTSVNLVGTTELLEACRRHGVRRFVFGSSSSVYGNNRKVPFAEDDPVDHPISPYAATKKAGEVLCHAHHHLFGIHVACLRFFTVYGPAQRPEMAIHKFARRIFEGRPIEQFGDGATSRDYTYVDDIVDGVVRATERIDGFRIWNLGGSETTPLAELIRKIGEGLGREPKVDVLPTQPGDVDRTWADIARARAELDWRPTTDIDEGLRKFLDWFRGTYERGEDLA